MKKTIVFLLILFFVGGVAMAKDTSPKQVNATKLKLTAFTASINVKMPKGKSLLFCSTFQLAWDALRGDIIKAPIKLSGNPLTARELNKKLIPKADVSPESYVALAGYKKGGIINKINAGLKNKFGKEAPSLEENLLLHPDDIIAYAFLFKNLKFAKEFEGLKDPITFDNGREKAKVQAFGIKKFEYEEKYKELAKQVSILHYKDDGEFVIKLNSVSPKDEIILAKITPAATLSGTIGEVNKLINHTAVQEIKLQTDDTLQIPKIDFDIMHNYAELENKGVLNKGFTGYLIAKAMQSIRFRLNEKGALLKSEAQIIMTKAVFMEAGPKHLVFDKPFLVCLKEKGAKYPYFAMWVDNAEVLIKE